MKHHVIKFRGAMRPVVTPTDTRIRAQVSRWVVGECRALLMRARVWWACLGRPPF
jgi:hypothetical protein